MSLVAASPPTRGWTFGGNRLDHVQMGFPTHAGMDPLAHDT